MATSRDEVIDTIREMLEEALGVDADEVTPDARLVEHLGAESIDFLDIVFRLEKQFDIHIDHAELFPDDLTNDPRYVKNGKVTDAGMAELRRRMPLADLDAFDADRAIENFPNIFTVSTLVRFVESKLGKSA